MSSAAFPATVPFENAERIRIDQHGKTIAQAGRVGIDKDGAIAFDASSENAPQAKQRATPADFTGLAAAITDDFAVGAKYRFQQSNRIQNRLPFFGFFHTRPDFNLAAKTGMEEVIS
jgi:hypothetical protein